MNDPLSAPASESAPAANTTGSAAEQKPAHSATFPAWLAVLLLLAYVTALRAPFLSMALQGDDVNYLAGGMHALVEPLHPNHARYAFLGEMVEMQGHPHPPLNAWVLGGLLALWGDLYESRFHGAYLLFSYIAALSAYSIARRLSPRPLLAALLFCTTLPFVVNGTSLESDLPLLAWWTASVALFLWAVDRHSAHGKASWPALLLCMGAQLLAAMTAYQSIVLPGVLALYLWRRDRWWLAGWASLLTIPLVIAGWQAYERSVTGSAPAQVLAGYFSSYGLQRLENKLRNAVALTVHLAWLVCPLVFFYVLRRRRMLWLGLGLSAAAGALAWLAGQSAPFAAWLDSSILAWASFGLGMGLLVYLAGLVRDSQQPFPTRWLAEWVLLFFAAALVIFFAGSARYLLPISLPLVLLATRVAPLRLLQFGLAAQLGLALLLAASNAQHWNGVRSAMQQITRHTTEKRLWINSEFGLRYYAEAAGGLPVLRGQPIAPGEYVVQSKLAYPIPLSTGGGVLAPVESFPVQPSIPLRLFGLGSRSGYSTADAGFRPFDWVNGPADVITLQAVTEKRPERSFLQMGAPEASSQIVSGIYELENNEWRWMSDRGVVLLQWPAKPSALEARIYIPDAAPGRRVTLACMGRVLQDKVLPGPGLHTLRGEGCHAPPEPSSGALVTLTIDQLFRSPNDQRRLGMIVSSIGFVAP